MEQRSLLKLVPRLHSRGEHFRAFEERPNVPVIQRALEAEPHHRSIVPPDHRLAAERPAVQGHRASDRKGCRTAHLRSARRQIEELGSVTLSADLDERRQRHGHPRARAALRIGIGLLGGGKGARHHANVAGGYHGPPWQEVNARRKRGAPAARWSALEP